MRRALLLLLTLLMLAPVAGAKTRPLVAVLDFTQVQTDLKRHEVQLLTDLARGAALRVLGSRYDIITRENLVDLLRAHGKTLEQCRGECETETGRLIGAEIVVSGRIVKAFGKLQVSLKVHRTSPPKLLGTQVGDAKDATLLPTAVGEVTRGLLGRLLERTEGPVRTAPGGKTGTEGTDADWDLATAVKVRVVTRPSGAAVQLGTLDAVSPLVDNFRPGRYRLTVSLPYYKTISTEVVVKPAARGEEVVFSYDLVPSYGSLDVKVMPPTAVVLLDGSKIGTGPTYVDKVALGPHRLMVRDPRHYEYARDITIKAGVATRVTVQLEGKMGGLEVKAVSQHGAALERDVLIDGKVVGRTPWRGKATIGKHTVQVVGARHPMTVGIPHRGMASPLTFKVMASGAEENAAVKIKDGGKSPVQTIAWVMIGTGAAEAMAAGVLYLVAAKDGDRVEDGKNGSMTQEKALELESGIESKQTAGKVLLTVSAISIGVGLILKAVSGGTRRGRRFTEIDPGPTNWRVGATPLDDGGLVTLGADF